MPVQIPLTPSLPFYSFQSVLDGVTYTLQIRWSEREKAYYLDLADANEDPIECGVKLVVEFSLLWRSTDDRIPPGELRAIDTASSETDPAFGDLGSRVQLWYYTAAELAG